MLSRTFSFRLWASNETDRHGMGGVAVKTGVNQSLAKSFYWLEALPAGPGRICGATSPEGSTGTNRCREFQRQVMAGSSYRGQPSSKSRGGWGRLLALWFRLLSTRLLYQQSQMSEYDVV